MDPIRYQYLQLTHPSQRPKNLTVNMKMIIALAALVAVAVAAPQGNQQDVVVVKETLSDNIGVDGYNFGYELSNGETRQERAELRNAGSENEALVVSGSFSWVDPTGKLYTVTYTADENGFHPVGDHIPA